MTSLQSYNLQTKVRVSWKYYFIFTIVYRKGSNSVSVTLYYSWIMTKPINERGSRFHQTGLSPSVSPLHHEAQIGGGLQWGFVWSSVKVVLMVPNYTLCSWGFYCSRSFSRSVFSNNPVCELCRQVLRPHASLKVFYWDVSRSETCPNMSLVKVYKRGTWSLKSGLKCVWLWWLGCPNRAALRTSFLHRD